MSSQESSGNDENQGQKKKLNLEDELQGKTSPFDAKQPIPSQAFSEQQLQELRQRQEQAMFSAIQQKLSSRTPLSEEEIRFLKNSPLPKDQIAAVLKENERTTQFQNLVQKQEQGKLSSSEERTFQGLLARQQLADEQLHAFENLSREALEKGGKKIVHFTDPHLGYEDLEQRLRSTLGLHEFDPSQNIFVSTGDILPDLIDQESQGLNAFNPHRIAKDGDLSVNEAQDFVSHYSAFLDYFGLDIETFETGGQNLADLGEHANQIFSRFIQSFYMMEEPEGLRPEEMQKFRETRDKVHEYLKKAIENHARKGYKKIKKILEAEGLNSDNAVLVAGNHDIEAIMREELGEYMIDPGNIKTVGGLRVGNYLSGSTGESMGFELTKKFGYGWSDVRKDPETKRTASYKKLHEKLKEVWNGSLSSLQLDKFLTLARLRKSHGLGSSDLSDYFERRIKPEMDHTIKESLKTIPQLDLSQTDLVVGHGDPGHPQFAGAEEQKVYQEILKTNKPYLFGHIHGPRSRMEGKTPLLGPGSAKYGNHGVYVFEKKDGGYKLGPMALAQYNKETAKLQFQATTPEYLSGQANLGKKGNSQENE